MFSSADTVSEQLREPDRDDVCGGLQLPGQVRDPQPEHRFVFSFRERVPLRLFHCCCGEIQPTPTLRPFSRLINRPAEIPHCVRNSQDTFVILNWHICQISRHPNQPTHQPNPAAEYIECYTLSAIFGFNQTMNLFGCSARPPPHLAITLPPKRARFRTASAGPHQTAAVIDSLFQVTVFSSILMI